MARIVWFSDLDTSGSGYKGISVALCQGLSELGHEVKVLGLNYLGEEHPFDFDIIPAGGFNDVSAMIQNLSIRWNFDVFICALDIPHQEQLLKHFNKILPQRGFKYIGIMAIEADPLCDSWSYVLMSMDKAFIISEFGAEAAREAGVYHAEHIQIGIDTTIWRAPTSDERNKLRKSLGIDEDEFVVLTVADNQERKNPHILLDTFAKFAKGKKSRYIFVTREHNLAGAKLKDYAKEVGIMDELMIFERGLPFSQLWGLYALSDAFLLASKSEGLGLPILEAMAVGLPVVATNCTAIAELLADNRGILVPYNFKHRDCFGNGWRYWFDSDKGAEALNFIYQNGFDTNPARKYVEARTWNIPSNQLHKEIERIKNERL